MFWIFENQKSIILLKEFEYTNIYIVNNWFCLDEFKKELIIIKSIIIIKLYLINLI